MTDENLNDFQDPAKLKAFFEEIDEETENLAGLYQQASAENEALRTCLMAILTALDDKMPAVRDIVLQTMEEAFEKACNPLYGNDPEDEPDPRSDALCSLITKIELANKLLPRE